MTQTMNNSIMIPLLIVLLTIHGVSPMLGESFSDAGSFKFIVSIWYFHEHRCSGSILDRTHILTTGHCVNDLPISLLSVATEIIERNPRNIQLVPVENIHTHPDFRAIRLPNGLYWENDIAVLELSEELNWGSTIAAIPLVNEDYNWDPCDICDLVGWNDDTVDGVKLLSLRYSMVVVMEDEICRNSSVYHFENGKCLDNLFETTVLEDGDHGAPVICKGSAVGIIIGGGTNAYNPPVLLSVYPYLEFIADILNVSEINVPYGNFQHYVAIFHNGLYHCAGSIIDSSHILTAAHCTENTSRKTLVVLPGRTQFLAERLNATDFSLVDRIHRHPDYERISYADTVLAILRNDVAVLTLRVPLSWSDTISAIGLADNLPIAKSCQVYRWSRTTTRQGETLLKSLWSSARIQDLETYKQINPFLERNRFCVMNTYALPIATNGDSGSPIICDGISVVGILSSHTLSQRLSWGSVQAIYYTTIFPYRKFISDAVANKIS